MVEPGATEVDPARAEELRRRLYQPDASEEDRLRFAALALSVEDERAAPPEDPATPPERRSRLLRPVVALVAVAAVAALLLVTDRPGPSASPSTAASPKAAGVIAGTEIRRELVAPDAGLPTATVIPTSLAGVDTHLQRFRGRGSAVVAIDASKAQQVNGTLLVMLTATPVRGVEWAATRPTRQPGHSQYVEVVATGEADSTEALPAYGMHVYDGSPPSRLLVEDRGASAWTLTVAFLPRRQSEQ